MCLFIALKYRDLSYTTVDKRSVFGANPRNGEPVNSFEVKSVQVNSFYVNPVLVKSVDDFVRGGKLGRNPK